MGAPGAPARIGIDLGGTKLAAVAIDDDGTIVASGRAPTPRSGDEIISTSAELVGELCRQADVVPRSLGIGAAGLVDERGVLRYGPNLPGIIDLDFVGALEPLVGVPVHVDNDATCGAVAEHHFGAARGIDTAVVVALGTGIGGGLILDGAVRRGAHHMAGEFGHILVDPGGVLCGCGQRGCWEQYASGRALGREARDAAAAGRAPQLLEAAGGDVEAIRGYHVTAAVASGQPDAVAIWDSFCRWVAVGLAALVNIVDPRLVVMGGGLVESGDQLLEPVSRYMDGMIMGAASRPAVPVVAATAGEMANAVGAAMLPTLA